MRLYHYLRKRGLALFMALVMCLSLLPAQAMADTMEPAPPAWEELETMEIRNLLNPDTTEFTAADLLNNQVGTKGTLVKLGIGDETGIREVNSGEKFQLVGSGIARAVEPAVHAVTWYAEDGTTPFYSAQYTEGQEMPQCPETPSKEADDKYTYAFTGWSDPVTGADGSISYTAIFTATAKEQEPVDPTVTWYNADGSVFDWQTFQKGTNAPTAPAAEKGTPSKTEDAQYIYTFDSWGEPVTDEVGNISYTAVFASTPKTAEGDSDEEIIMANDQTFSDGGPAFVQLYGVFDYPTDGKMKVLSVNIIETNGTKTPLPTDFDLTRELTLEIDVDTPGKDKEFDVTVPMGVYITNLFTNKDKGYGHIAAVEPKPSPTVVQDLKEYTTLHYTYTDDTARGIFSVKLSFGSFCWNRLKVEFDKAIQITDSKGNELYSAKAHRNADGGIYSSCVPGYISRKAGPKNTFVWADARFNMAIFSKDIEVTLTCPYDPVTDQYAKFSHLSRKGAEPVDVYTVTEDEDTHTITIKGHNTWRLYLNTNFYWEKPLQDSTATIPGPKISFKGDFYLGGERSAEFTLGSPKVMPAPAIWIGTIGSNIRYNWHEENPDLVYSLAQFDMGNSGGTGELNQMVTFTYNQADAVRVMGQVFPVTNGKSVIKVEYKTNFADWREYGNIYAGKYYTLWTADLPLQENEYLVATRAIVPPYGAGYICDNQHVFTYGQLKENGEYLENVPVSTMTLQDVNENGEPVNSEKAKTATFHLTLSRKPDDSTPLSIIKFNDRTATLYAGGSSKKLNFTVGISSPDSFTRTSSYIFEPVLFIRLPQSISLVDGSVEIPGISNKDENGIDQNVEVIPKGNQDGFTVYEIHPKTPGDFAAGGGLNKKNAMKSWSLTFSIIADKSSPECTYNIGNMVYMRNNNGGKGTFGSDGSLIVHASSDPIEFDSEAKDTDTCIFDPQTGRVYVSQDGEVKFRFTVKNPIGKELNENVLKNFVYYIPAPSTDVEGLSFKLTGAELVDNTEKLSLSFTKDSVASERSNWTEEYASDAKWIRVQIPAGVTLQTNESASFEVSFQLEGITDEMLGKQFTINCNGRLVSPNADNTEDTTMLAIVVSNGTLTGTLYKDANWDGEHGDDESPYPKQTITAISTDGSHTVTAETDEHGCYTLKGLRALEYNITVVNPGSTVVTDSTALHFPAALNTADEHKTASTTIDMTDGGAAKTLDIGMLPPCEITFTATNAAIAGGVMDGAGCQKVDKVWYNDPITAPSIEANEGYTFKGWTENGSTEYVQFGTEGKPQLATSNRTFAADCGDADLHHVTVTVNHLETFYDGKTHEVSGFVGETKAGIPVTVTSGDGNEKTFYIKGGLTTQKVSGKDVSDSKQKIDVIIDKQNLQVVDAEGNPVKDRFEITTVPGSLIIKPRTVTLTSGSETWNYDGEEHSLPVVTISDFDGNGGNGFVSGEGYETPPTATGSITNYGYVVNDITDGQLKDGTKAGNYTIVKVQGTLCVQPNPDKAKFEVTVTAQSGEFTYDGSLHTVNGFVVDNQTYANGNRIPVTVEGGKTYYVSGLSSSKTSTNVADSGQTEISGSVQVWDAETEGKNVTQDFLVKVVPGKLTIKPRAITLTSGSKEAAYNGTALTEQNVTATLTSGGNGDAFVGGDGAEYTYYASQLNVGSCDNVFTYKLKDGTLAGNYDITTKFGTLTVTTLSTDQQYSVKITAGSDTVKYDGKEHTVNTFTINGGTTEYASGTAASFTASNGETYTISGIAVSNPEAKNVATDGYQVTVIGNYKVTDEFGNDVTNQFKFETKAGKLTITPRQVTLTSANDSKPYDGRPLTNHTVTVGGDGFVEGEGVTYSFTGSQTLVGSTEGNNTFSIASWNAGTLEDNYKPTIIPGTLTVTDRPNDAKYEITVETGNKAVTYNGQEQSLPGSFTKDVLIDGRTYTVKVTADDATGKNAGTYHTGNPTYTVTTQVDGKEKDVTAQFNVHVTKGTLTINKRLVTLTSPSASKAYDGTALTAPEVTIGGEGFVNGEVDLGTVKATGSAMNAGDSVTNAITYTKGSSYKDSNYAITKYEGTLQVYDRSAKYEVTIKAVDASAVYNGEKHSITKYSIDGEEGATTITRNGQTFDITGMSIPTNGEANAGTYTVSPDTTNVTVTDSAGTDVTNQFHIVAASGTLTITPRPVLLESKSASKVYDGTALTAEMNEPSTTANDGKSAFISDDDKQQMVCTSTGSRTLVGFSPNTFDWNWKDGTADTTKSNYAISVKTGTLTVTNPDPESKYQITVKVDDLTVTYDGKPHKITDCSVVGSDSITVENNHTFYMNEKMYTIEGLSVNCEARTNVEDGPATATVTGGWVIKDVRGHVVSEAFKVTPEGGTLTITPRPITLRSGSDSKVYDGKPLSKEGVTVEGTFADKEGFDYSNFKHVTFVTAPEGEDNTFDYAGKAGTNTKLSNYDVKVEPGKLIIRDRSAADRYPVTVKRDGKEVVYNGREQSIDAETITQVVTVGEGEDAREYTVTVVIPKLAGIDAGTYPVDRDKVTVAVITKDSNGEDVNVTAQFDVKLELGDLTINKKFLTITTEGGSMTYSGQPLTNPNVTVDGLENGETLVVRTTGSQTAVGSSANNYVIDWANSTAKEDNYQITSVLGQLVVNASQPPIIIPTPTPTPTPVTPTPTPTPTPGGTTITDEETPLAGAVGLNDTDHFAYIAGYEDDTVRPTKNITRAEVATIFFRLMTEEFRVANWATENTLKDVLTGDWYNNAVSTCANAGIITGYTDGRFQPQKDITRAEFAVIASRFLGPDADDEGVGDFSDTANHWAAAEIRKAAKAGWITGDGNKFRPNDPITRAEVMVIVNRMLDRTPDAGHMLPDMKTWIDNPEGTWYYEAVQEATNGHDYERDELNVETWTAIQTEKNWKAIEAEWAANNGASASKDDAESVEADGESK